MKIRVGLVALLAVLAASWSPAHAATVITPVIGPKVYDGLLELGKAAGYKAPYGAAYGTADVVGEAVNLGSKIKYVGAWGLVAGGAVLFNAAMQWGMGSLASQAFGEDAAHCMSYSFSKGLQPGSTQDMLCESRDTYGPFRVDKQAGFPEPGETVWWWQPVNPEVDSHFFRVSGNGNKYGDGILRYTVGFNTCAASESGTTDLTGEDVLRRWTYFQNDMMRTACNAGKVTTRQINYNEYRDGVKDEYGSQLVKPHPNLDGEIAKVVPAYLGTVRPYSMPTDLGQPWPGVKLDPTPNPNQIGDQPLDPFTDTDGDGVPDGAELDPPPGTDPTDPNDPQSKPETPEEKAAKACADSGGTYSGGVCTPAKDPQKECEAGGGTWSGTTCTPPKDCPEGQVKQSDGTCKEPPKDCPEGQVKQSDGTCKPPEDPDPGNTCGDFSIPRLLKHAGDWAHDLIFPCDTLKWTDFTSLITSKFPFSIAASAAAFVSSSGGGTDANPLPTDIGPFHLDFSWASGFFAFIKVAFRTALWFFFFRFMLDRVSGQVVLS